MIEQSEPPLCPRCKVDIDHFWIGDEYREDAEDCDEELVPYAELTHSCGWKYEAMWSKGK